MPAFEENRYQRIDFLRIYDNSANFGQPRLVLNMFRGVPRRMTVDVPAWLETALEKSDFSIANLRGAVRRSGLAR